MKKNGKMKFSDYFKFIEPEYIYLQIIPTTSVRNYHSDNILKLIASLYRSFNQHIKRINHQFIFESPAKVSFYIYMEKETVEFYFIVPKEHYTLFKNKLDDAWGTKVSTPIVAKIPWFNHDSTKFYMDYKKEDAMSLVTDKRSNVLLASELSILYNLEDDDKAGILFNFIPLSQQGWRAEYDNTMKRLMNDQSINKNKLNFFLFVYKGLDLIVRGLDMVLSSINLGSPQIKKVDQYIPTDDTRDKKKATIIGTQIICFSESKDKLREYNNCQSLCNSFQSVTSQDNELVGKRLRIKEINHDTYQISKATILKTSHRESQNFVSVAGRELIEEHKVIKHTKVLTIIPPKELLKGIIPLGTLEGKDKEKLTVYMSTTETEKNLPYAIVGANRTGKSTYLSNIAYHSQKGGECTIYFDFCGDCNISDEINEVCKNVLNIDCSNLDKLQGMGYNEVRANDNDTFRHYDNVKGQATQLIALVNSMNEADRDLKTKMNKLLRAAAILVFLNNGCFKDVFSVLQDHELRHKYIKMIKSEYYERMDKHVKVLTELDDIKGGVIIGSKSNPAIYGIMDRIDNLQANTYMELMFEKNTKNNFNLIDEMQKSQVICFRMPEVMFKNDTEKDSFCTYWMSKIWLALKLRQSYIDKKDLVKVNIIIDELYQVEHCEEFVRSILNQMPKFNARMILSCHHINQLTSVKNELLNANGSYILIAGCSKQNFTALKEEMYPYTLEDLMGLKKWYSLNIIKLGDGYESFVVELPKPLNKIGKDN